MSGEHKAQLICLSVVLTALVVVKISWSSRLRKRPKQLSTVAQRLGLDFRPDKDVALAGEWHFLDTLHGWPDEIRYAFNVLEGRRSSHRVLIFDYHYQDESRGGFANPIKDRTVLILQLEGASFPKLFISWEIARAIRFESAEFSQRYGVVSDDKKFAYDVCNPQMIEFLLANPPLRIEINGPALVLDPHSLLHPDLIEMNLQRLLTIRSRLPEYLFTKV